MSATPAGVAQPAEITLTAGSEGQALVDAWPVLLDEVRANGDCGLVRIQISAPFPHRFPEGFGAKIAGVIRGNWWAVHDPCPVEEVQ